MAARRRSGPAATARPAKKPAGKGRVPPTDVHEIQVTLRDTDPPVWRRILVPGNFTLGRLHGVLQAAMGWQHCHMHMFRVGGTTYGDLAYEREAGDAFSDGDEADFTVAEAFRAGMPKVVYEYDFGDCWEHDLSLVKVLPPAEAPAIAPFCVDGARACPPEDVGGTTGYEEFLAAMADPKHPRHEDFAGWLEGPFDPEGFDRDAVNRRLRLP